ncbi:SMI1/KNR4 family protein [Anaerosacchariphilus polymeriproducens]|uniref:Knr4/Smi1-like domain-containing protein n=1 Tax=Anaerosacchariphilus polymeriproducens TaxID=1812858 RepID=A0A371AUN4_9FIRM|nr:SMI1/KNR4 family protein [Anaerosacchariphilus polymeriproducens]RDU23252.1 hypothetical protein DWV06_10780 [Anaerosacchariphilus polymeriproducens]
MNKEFIIMDEDNFYEVNENEINDVENELNIQFPKELRSFYLKCGYGFLGNSESNINRIMDPLSVRDFRLRQNDFEFYPDIELYDQFENGKLIFFEANETALISIELTDSEKSKIYYYDTPIAESLSDFLEKLRDNEEYYLDLI